MSVNVSTTMNILIGIGTSTGYRIQVSSYKLQVTSNKLQVTSCRLQLVN